MRGPGLVNDRGVPVSSSCVLLPRSQHGVLADGVLRFPAFLQAFKRLKIIVQVSLISSN